MMGQTVEARTVVVPGRDLKVFTGKDSRGF